MSPLRSKCGLLRPMVQDPKSKANATCWLSSLDVTVCAVSLFVVQLRGFQPDNSRLSLFGFSKLCFVVTLTVTIVLLLLLWVQFTVF